MKKTTRIGVGGPVGSGKTALIEALTPLLIGMGLKVLIITNYVVQPGRKDHGAGELFEFDLYSSTLTASRPDGTSLFTEKLVAEPWRHPVRQAGANPSINTSPRKSQTPPSSI